MKILFASVQVMIIVSSVVAQPIEWHKGAVILSNKEVLTGSIYHPKGFDVIFLRSDDGNIVLNAGRIQLFRYYDSSANINRKFVSINAGSE